MPPTSQTRSRETPLALTLHAEPQASSTRPWPVPTGGLLSPPCQPRLSALARCPSGHWPSQHEPPRLPGLPALAPRVVPEAQVCPSTLPPDLEPSAVRRKQTPGTRPPPGWALCWPCPPPGPARPSHSCLWHVLKPSEPPPSPPVQPPDTYIPPPGSTLTPATPEIRNHPRVSYYLPPGREPPFPGAPRPSLPFLAQDRSGSHLLLPTVSLRPQQLSEVTPDDTRRHGAGLAQKQLRK